MSSALRCILSIDFVKGFFFYNAFKYIDVVNSNLSSDCSTRSVLMFGLLNFNRALEKVKFWYW